MDEPTCPLCLTPQPGDGCGFCLRYAVEVAGYGVLAEALTLEDAMGGFRQRWALHTPMGNRLTYRVGREWRVSCTCEARQPCAHVAIVREAARLLEERAA